MPSSEIDYLRLLLAEPNAPTGTPPIPGQAVAGSLFNDDALSVLIERTAMLSRAAEIGWKVKASYFQTLIDVDESGSSRKLSQMFNNALAMAQQYKIAADEELAALQGAVRTVGVGAAPWGPQFAVPGLNGVSSYIIGDVSNAGYGGSIFFIEVPVDPNLLTETFDEPINTLDAPVLEVSEMQVPTNRRQAMYVEQGRTFSYWLDYLDPRSATTVDLTGWTATLTVKTAPGGVQLYTVALSVDVSDCRFVLTIPDTDSANFAFTQGAYEIVATDTSSNSISLLNGTMIVSEGTA